MQRVKIATARGFKKPAYSKLCAPASGNDNFFLVLSFHTRARSGARSLKDAAPPERARNHFSELGSERFLGDFLSSKETIFLAEGGTGTAPSRTIAVALTFFP